jgi:hypothetical protein
MAKKKAIEKKEVVKKTAGKKSATAKTAKPGKKVTPGAKTAADTNEALRQYLDAHPQFNLLTYDFYGDINKKSKAAKDSAAGLKEQGLEEKAMLRQRMLRVWPDVAVAEKLEKMGYDSAARIAYVPRWRFIRDAGKTLNTKKEPALAQQVHASASAITEKMKHVYASVHSTVASPHYRASMFSNTSDEVDEYVQGIPSYQVLFGDLDFCKCDECRSIFSPAAYFLDIMRITDDYITEVNAATIPKGLKLEERRPDLFNMKLTCANTNDPVPTIRIINEVMEDHLEAGQIVVKGTAQSGNATSITLDTSASGTDNAYAGMLVYISAGTGSGQQQTITAYSGSSKTATVMNAWERMPDNTSQYVITRDIYSLMAVSPYPFNLPWNLPLEQSRLYTASLGTSLTDIYTALLAPLQWGNVGSATSNTIVFATTTQPAPDSYVNMTVEIANGTAQGELRRITAYDAGTKTATVDSPWGTIPDNTSQYYISNPGPALRESLGLTVEQGNQLTTPLVSGATLSPQFGYSGLSDTQLVTSLTPLDEFMWRTGLSRTQVVSLLTQDLTEEELSLGIADTFYINATGEELHYMQLGEDVSGDEAIAIVQYLTVKRLDRLNRFIRLAAETGWSYATTDWVMKACQASEITPLFLAQAAQVSILCAQTSLSPEVVCSLWYLMKNYGRVSITRRMDLFDTIYNNPLVLKGKDPYTSTFYIPFDPYNHPGQQWVISDNTGLNATIRGRLGAALSLNDNDLTQIAMFVYSQVTEHPSGTPALALSYENLSWMYRLVVMAKVSKLSPDAFLLYLSLCYYPEVTNYTQPPYGSYVPSIDMVFATLARTDWLKKSNFTPYQLEYILTGIIPAKYNGPTYNPVEVQKFVQSLAAISESSRMKSDSFMYGNIDADASAKIFDQMVLKEYIDAYGIMLVKSISFQQAAELLPIPETAFISDNIDAEMSKQVFTLLTENPASTPYLVNVTTVNNVRYAQLAENYYAYSPLDFLFVSKGAGQQNQVKSYDGATHTVSVNTEWTTVPDTTSWYTISVDEGNGTAQGATIYSIVLAETAMAEDGYYNGMEISITGGTGKGQKNKILSYTGETREAVVDKAWTVMPDNTSVYALNNILNSGFAQSATTNTIVLDVNASSVDNAYNNDAVCITTDPKAELKRGEVRKKLVTYRNDIEHTAAQVPQFETLQNENCLQALAGFMHSSATMISVLLPFAASVNDLSSYLEAMLVPVPSSLESSFLPFVTQQSFVNDLITADQSTAAYNALVSTDPQIIIPNDTPSYIQTNGKVSSTFSKSTPLDFLYTGQDQAELKRTYTKSVLLMSQRAYQVNQLVQSLSRSILLADRINLTATEVAFILSVPGCCNISNVDQLMLNDIIIITGYKSLVIAFNNNSDALNIFFGIPKQAVLPNSKTDALVKITGWDSQQLCALIQRYWPLDNINQTHTTYGCVPGVMRLKNAFDLSAKTGIDIYSLVYINNIATLPLADSSWQLITANWVIYEQTAQLLLSSSSSKLGDVAFAEADKVISKTLMTSQRNALLPYLIWQLHSDPNFTYIRNSNDVYQYLLLDVEMSACDTSSYIAQGIASVQVYLQRCRMNFEAGVTDLSNIGTAWWEWMMAYRLWEVNRKIFLYPENYIDPTLYTYASPAFKKFEEALQQTNISDQTVTEAFNEYMGEFNIVAGLVQCASYTTTIHDDQSGKDIERLYIFGHTAEQPYTYYYRTFDKSYSWSAWQEMDISIASPLVSPVYAFKRLYIFWVEISEQSGSTIVSNNSIPNSASVGAVKFSFLNLDGSWYSPQTLQEGVVIDYQSNYQFDQYVSSILPLMVPSYNPDLVYWRKVYPLYLPQESFYYPNKYPNNESIAILYGFGLTTAPGQSPPVPDPPPTNINEAQYQLEYSSWKLVSNYSSVGKVNIPGQTTYVAKQASVVYDASLSRQTISPVLINYRPDYNPTPYIPYLNRTASMLGINETFYKNIIVDNYMSDDPAAFPTPGQTATPQLQLLNNVSPNTTSITTVKNTVGRFIFDNGDESFLVVTQEQGIKDITTLLSSDYSYSPFPSGFFYFYTSSYTDTPTELAKLKFNFLRLSTRAGNVFSAKLMVGGVEQLLTIESQETPEFPFSRLSPQAATVPPLTDKLDFYGAYGLYFQEIFFHAPFLVASMLQTHQQFDYAKQWYEYIFNPTQQPGETVTNPEDRFWRYLPFRNMDMPSLIQTLTNPAQIDAYNNDPFNPDAIAKLRPSAYAKAVVMKYISNIIAWADNLFAQDTRESINQATNLYILAQSLLGEKPELVSNCPVPKPLSYNEIKAMYNNQTVTTGTAQAGTAISITLANTSSTQKDAYTGMYIQVTAGTGVNQTNFITAYTGSTFVATVSEPWTTTPDSTSVYRIYLDNIPQFYIHLENSQFNDPAQLTNYEGLVYNDIPSYFCVPENSELVAYWGLIEDRLFKIRHCMNINGEERPLALFAPPIDPRLVIAAAASGNAGMLTSAQLDLPIPAFRFDMMLERARNFTSTVMGFGSSLLAALERKDAEVLSVMQNAQERVLLEMNMLVRTENVNMYIANGAALNESLKAANERYTYYNMLVQKGLNTGEILNIAGMTTAMALNVASSIMTAASAVAFLIPNVGSPFAMTYGGEQIGSSLSAAASVFQAGAIISDFVAQLSLTIANYQRRAEEWQFQSKQAQFESAGLTYQIQSNSIQQKIAEQEVKIQETTIQQNQETGKYLQDKFTNAELYQWMVTRLSTVYFQAYSLAYELAREAQRSYQYELNTNQSFINFGYWDNLKKGLLAGDSLMLSLMQMEKSWIDKNVRTLEIEKTVSLRQLDPNAFLSLVETGECLFSLGEKLYDDDYPGHYARKIKSISVSIPAVLGPNQDFHVTLTQLTNQVILKPDVNAVNFLLGGSDAETPAADVLRTNWNNSQMIAVSNGVNDSGMFEVSFNDQRYLPFEGTGAVSNWRLSMPESTNLFNFASVSDVIVQVKYTALNGGSLFKQQVLQLEPMRTRIGSRFFNMAQNFSQQWYTFMNVHPLPAATQTLQFSVDSVQPPHIENPVLAGFYFQLEVPEGISTQGSVPYITLLLGTGVDVTFNLDKNNACTAVMNNPPPIGNVLGSASISFNLSNTPAALKTSTTPAWLDPAIVLNAVLILFWSGENPKQKN